MSFVHSWYFRADQILCEEPWQKFILHGTANLSLPSKWQRTLLCGFPLAVRISLSMIDPCCGVEKSVLVVGRRTEFCAASAVVQVGLQLRGHVQQVAGPH